ncbi:MAG: enoyl-CoA hydratase-related protein [Bacteroidales bacterium]
MDYKFLKTENRKDHIGILTISAPKSLNALNTVILTEINDYIDNLDESIRVLIVTGDGPKAFVAGADIAEMKIKNAQEALEFGEFGSSVFKKIEDLEIPVIAAVNGFALGGGCELSLACDIRIASENARFGQPEVTLGIIPGFSGTVRLTKICGMAVAKELIFTGKMIKADEAYRVGLISKICPLENLMEECLKMAGAILKCAPIAVKNAKASINKVYDVTRDEAIKNENNLFSECFASEDQTEGMSAFLEKRKPVFNNK